MTKLILLTLTILSLFSQIDAADPDFDAVLNSDAYYQILESGALMQTELLSIEFVEEVDGKQIFDIKTGVREVLFYSVCHHRASLELRTKKVVIKGESCQRLPIK